MNLSGRFFCAYRRIERYLLCSNILFKELADHFRESLQNHILPGCLTPGMPLQPPAIFGNGTSAPRPHGTNSAISYVLAYGICSLLPPCAFVVATTTRKDSSERPLRPFPFGTGLASPYCPTHRVGVSAFN